MSTLLALLPVLACPLGMGLMMWLMMRGKKDQAGPAAAAAGPDDRLASIRAQLGEVEAQQATLAAQLDRFRATDPSGSAGEAALAGTTEPVVSARRLAKFGSVYK